jgi:hypothetical protein
VLEVPTHELTVDDHQGSWRSEILPALQPRERPVRHVESLSPTRKFRDEGGRELSKIVFDRCNVQPPLRIKNILPPRFVEADGNVMIDATKRFRARRAKTPGPQKPWSAWSGQAMALNPRSDRRLVPGAGKQMNFVAI